MTRANPIPDAPWPRPSSARAWLAERSDGTRLHAGVDIGHGRQVVQAPEAGIVRMVAHASYANDVPRFSDPRGWAGYGPFAVLLEGAQQYHLLAHVDAVQVRPGQVLEAGDAIATVAPRGNHLHWEVRTRRQPPASWATVEISLDPQQWVDGRQQAWSREHYGCPPNSLEDRHTPRACRPGAGPTPIPRETRPRPRPAPGFRPFTEPEPPASRPGQVIPLPLGAPRFLPRGASDNDGDDGEGAEGPAASGSSLPWSSFS